MIEIFQNPIFLYFLIPFLIFLSRIIDVSLGTIRIILANKGIKKVASIIGFFEVLLWIIVISAVMENLNNYLSYFAYAIGFSLGTYVGISLEEKISLGQVRLRVITKKDLKEMIDDMKPTKYVFVSENVNSSDGKIKIINAFIERKYLKVVLDKIKKRDKEAFYTVEDLKMIKRDESDIHKSFSLLRKSK